MKKRILKVSALITSFVLILGCLTSCGNKKTNEQKPVTTEQSSTNDASKSDDKNSDEITYTTDVESFWVGIGKAYLTFSDNEKDGKVFAINVNSGDGYGAWVTGTWDLDESKGILTITANWDESSDTATKLTDGTSGEPMTYEVKDGKYEIPVTLPSAEATFTLDPETDAERVIEE